MTPTEYKESEFREGKSTAHGHTARQHGAPTGAGVSALQPPCASSPTGRPSVRPPLHPTSPTSPGRSSTPKHTDLKLYPCPHSRKQADTRLRLYTHPGEQRHKQWTENKQQRDCPPSTSHPLSLGRRPSKYPLIRDAPGTPRCIQGQGPERQRDSLATMVVLWGLKTATDSVPLTP